MEDGIFLNVIAQL